MRSKRGPVFFALLFATLAAPTAALEPFVFLAGGRVYLFEKGRRRVLAPELEASVTLFSVAPTGRRFALHVRGRSYVSFHDGRTGRRLGSLNSRPSYVGKLVWSPDGERAALVYSRSIGTQDIPSSSGYTTEEIDWIDFARPSTGSYRLVMDYKLVSRNPERYSYNSDKPYGTFIAWSPDSSRLWMRDPADRRVAHVLAPGRPAPESRILLSEGLHWGAYEAGCWTLNKADEPWPLSALWDAESSKPLFLPELPGRPVYHHAACPRPLRQFAVVHASTEGLLSNEWTLSVFAMNDGRPRPLAEFPAHVPRGLRWVGQDLLIDRGRGIERVRKDGRPELVLRRGSLQELPLRNPYHDQRKGK